MIKIKIRILSKDLKIVFILLLISTLLFTTQKTLTVNATKGQLESIRDSDWFWTATKVISTESTDTAQFPEIAIDSVGNLHVVWEDLTDYLSSGTDRDIFYKRWEVNTNTWTTTEVISEGDVPSLGPDIAVDSSDNIHFVWGEFSSSIEYRKWVAATQSWSSIITISTESTANPSSPSIEIDTSDNIHVVWSDDTDYLGSGGEYDVFYKIWNETKQAWSTTQVVSTESTDPSYTPQLTIDSFGNVHVTWYDSTDYLGAGLDLDIFYKYLDASTKIWQPTELLSNESNGISSNPDLAVDSLDNVHLVWDDEAGFDGAQGGPEIFYSIRDKESETWTIPEVISDAGETFSYFPSIDIDKEDNIHVAWEDDSVYHGAENDYDIFLRMYSSNKEIWLDTEVISTDSTSTSRFASIAIGKYGSVNIAWADWTNLTYCGGDADIFFKKFIGPPAEPKLEPIVPDQIGTDMLQLRWFNAEGVRNYYVYRDISYIWSVDHLDPIDTLSVDTTMDTLPTTGVYYYVVVADNLYFNSSVSNCIYVEYSVAHVKEFAISISILTIVAMLVITIRTRQKRNKN